MYVHVQYMYNVYKIYTLYMYIYIYIYIYLIHFSKTLVMNCIPGPSGGPLKQLDLHKHNFHSAGTCTLYIVIYTHMYMYTQSHIQGILYVHVQCHVHVYVLHVP